MPNSHLKKIPLTIAYYLAFASMGLLTAAVGPSLPGFAEQTGSSLSSISFLFTARSFGFLIGSFFFGKVYDKLAGSPMQGWFLVVMALLTVTIPYVPMLWLMIVILFLSGVSQGGIGVGGNTLIVWIHPKNVGPWMTGMHFFFGVGAFISPIIISESITSTGSYDYGYYALALIILPIAAWLFFLPSPKPVHTKKETQGTATENRRVFLMILLLFFVYTGSEMSFGGWVYTYALELNLAGESGAGYLTSLFWAAITIGRLIAVPVTARLLPKTILFIDFLGMIFSALMILVFSSSSAVLWAGTAALGLFMASAFPTIFSFAERRMKITGSSTGWFFTAGSSSAMTFPLLTGYLFESVSPLVMLFTLLISGTMSLVVLGLLVLISEPAKRENLLRIIRRGHTRKSPDDSQPT